MKKVILMDPELLDLLENRNSPDPDPELLFRVNEALEQLDPEYRAVLRMWYYDGARMRDIASAFDKPEKDIKGMLYEAKRQMTILLAEFVRKRWGVEADRICRVCAHAQRDIIEQILIEKAPGESWKRINDKIFKAIGAGFHPPQILKAHIKHMNLK